MKRPTQQDSRPTIRDVAREAGVSIGTVSNALNNSAGVSEAVRERIVAVAARLGYRPNNAAQATRTGRTRTLAFISPDLTNPFYAGLARVTANTAQAEGYATLLIDTQDGTTERSGIEHMARYGVDGILWCPATASDVIASSQIVAPVVVFDSWFPGRDSIVADYRMSGRLIADHVAARGYRSVGMISGPQDIPSVKYRRDQFLQHLDGRVPVAWEIDHPFEMRLTDEGRQRIAERRADVLVCCDDLMAIAALQVALDLGLRVPEDIAVIGHDDIPIATAVRPELTTIRQPIEELARAAVQLIIERIEQPARSRRDVVVGVELVERDSTR